MRFLPLQQQLTTITTTNSYHIALHLSLSFKRFYYRLSNYVFFAKKPIKNIKTKTRGKK